MEQYQKIMEALDAILESMDTILDPSLEVLTESQMDDEVQEHISDYLEDVDAVVGKMPEDARTVMDERLEEMIEATDPELFVEKNIVRLDRKSILNQLVGLFSLVLARRRKDPAFALYKKGSAIRRKAKNAIKAKYSARAVPIARTWLKRRKFR